VSSDDLRMGRWEHKVHTNQDLVHCKNPQRVVASLLRLRGRHEVNALKTGRFCRGWIRCLLEEHEKSHIDLRILVCTRRKVDAIKSYKAYPVKDPDDEKWLYVEDEIAKSLKDFSCHHLAMEVPFSDLVSGDVLPALLDHLGFISDHTGSLKDLIHPEIVQFADSEES
jgi:hypothetical protein